MKGLHMPNITAPGAAIKTTQSYKVTSIDAAGFYTYSGLNNVDALVSPAQLNTWSSAIGRASNAQVIANTSTTKAQIAKSLARPFDEAESSGSVKGVLIFENEDLDTKEITWGAPDLTLFSGGVAIVPDFGAPAAPPTAAQVLGQLITATLDILNEGATPGTYGYLKGYLQRPGKPTPNIPNIVTVEEPGATDVPGPGPGA